MIVPDMVRYTAYRRHSPNNTSSREHNPLMRPRARTQDGLSLSAEVGARYKAIIFDFDGTLYDSRSLARRFIFSDPINAFRMKAERIARRALLGHDMGDMASFRAELLRRTAAIMRSKTETIGAWYVEKYLPLTVRVLKKYYKARKNADCLLESLRVMGIKTAVLSDYPCVQDRLNAIGLDAPLFDAMLSAEETGALKPCARPFLETANALGVSPSACLVVGDREDTDGDGARACGMDFVKIAQRGSKAYNGLTWDDFTMYALLSVE